VILAVYYPGTLEIARGLGESLAGKVVVDISNPLNETYDGLATEPGTSAAAEEVAAALPAGAGLSRPSTPPSPVRWLKARWQANR
jgi:predicted dinucleotide-binding enzyme